MNPEKVSVRVTRKRPKIPANVERAVLIESGHRCAVCGEACPLQRAHIIPWRVSKLHRLEDLICLCANCHQRADLENWGEQILREYKRNPWILRKGRERDLLALPDQPIQQVELTLGLTLKGFEAARQRLLLYALAAFLDIAPDEIRVISIKEGSVKIVMELPREAARRLKDAHDRGNVDLQELLVDSNLLAIEVLHGRSVVDVALDCDSVATIIRQAISTEKIRRLAQACANGRVEDHIANCQSCREKVASTLMLVNEELELRRQEGITKSLKTQAESANRRSRSPKKYLVASDIFDIISRNLKSALRRVWSVSEGSDERKFQKRR